MARAAVLRRRHMVLRFTGRDAAVVALGTTGVREWERRRAAYRPEAAVIDRRQAKAAACGMTGATALARYGGVKIYHHLWASRHTLNRRIVVARGASLARDRGRGMVNEPAHEGRRVMAAAAVGRRGYMTGNLARGIQSIVTGATRDGVPCQYAVIEHTAHVVAGGVVADVTRLSDVPRRGVRIRR